MRALFNASLFRFGIVSVLGIGLDLAVAWTLAVGVGLDLPLAAISGFVAGAISNYVLHHVWTFNEGLNAATPRRAGLYLLTLGLTLGTRLAVIAAAQCSALTSADQVLATLVLATGASFVVNYLLSRYVVFAPGPPPAKSKDATPK